MAQKIKFTEPPRPIPEPTTQKPDGTWVTSGLTPFGYYEPDKEFRDDAQKVALWVARRLGWPTVDIEISDADIYAAFEEAIMEYSSLVNEYNIRENLYTLRGTSTSENVTGRYISSSPVPFLIKLARSYGSMVRAGGYVKYRKDFIVVGSGVAGNEIPSEFVIDKQTYDLAGYLKWKIEERMSIIEERLGIDILDEPDIIDDLVPETEEEEWLLGELKAFHKLGYGVLANKEGRNPSDVIVKKIYHYRTPYTAYGMYKDNFGAVNTFPAGLAHSGYFWDQNDLGAGQPMPYYSVMPVNEQLLRIQALEFNDTVRKSHYSFEMVGGRVKLFPVPTGKERLWFEYVFEDEFEGAQIEGVLPTAENESGAGEVVTDISNAPYDLIPYSKLNGPARRWVLRYTLAVAKHKLGTVRSKFDSVPTPLDSFRLDGESLKSEAIDEQRNLVESLRETLQSLSRSEQMNKMTEEAEQLQRFLTKVPTRLYTG